MIEPATALVVLLGVGAVVAWILALLNTHGSLHPIQAALVALAATATHLLLIGWISALIAVGIALATVVVLVLTGILSRGNTFLFPALLIFVPYTSWWVYLLLVGTLIAASVITLLRSGQLQQVKTIAFDTMVNVQTANPEQIRASSNAHASSARPAISVALCTALALGLACVAALILR